MSSSVLSGRRALITGATDGIGRHTAAGLADRGAHVTIVGRDQVRGRTAAVDITRETGNPEVEFVSADLSTRSGVRALAERIGTGPLDILINNVGGLYMTRWETEDGVEASLAMNALNPLLLTTLLQPALAAAPAARVVYVTGGMPGRIDPAALQSTDKYLGMRTYSHTKSVMMALAYEQAQRWRPTGITVNVAYPGGADTPMTRAMTPAGVPMPMRAVWPLFKPIMARARPERAARSSITLASEPGLAGVTGTYVNTRSKPARWPADVLDPALRGRLWATARALLGLPAQDDAVGGPGAPSGGGRTGDHRP